MEPRQVFSSSTLMGREQNKKVIQLLQNLIDSPDSYQFRTPVDYLAYGLLDYPSIIKKPMDLGTVRNNLNNNSYPTVQSCLSDIQLIWDNCKTYNNPDNWIYKQAEKLEKLTKKMIKNYASFVKMESQSEKKRGPQKNATVNKKAPIKGMQAEPKNYIQKQQEKIEKPKEQEVVETEFARSRKQFLMFVPLCTPEQVGVLFLLTQKHNSEALTYDDLGNVQIDMDNVTDQMLSRLVDQLDMWGIGFVSSKKK